MDQSELNAIAQKWLESLLHPPESQESPSTLAVQPGPQELSEVLGKLRYLLRLNEIPKTSLRAGGTHLVVLARSLAAYLMAALDGADLERASRSLNQHTTKALMTIFRLTGKKLTPFYHDDRKEGITRAAQMALYTKYSQYALKGAAVFHENPPVFYISEAGFANDCNNLCGSLGITLSSCRQVPCSDESSFNSMDVAALENQVEEDLKEGRMPVMVIAYAGTPLAGHVEDMAGIRAVCKKHKLWMHVQGHALSSLCLQSTDKEVLQCREADSVTLYPGTWFGLLSSPALTLHRTPYIIETELMENSSEFPPSDLELVEGSIPIPRVCWNGMLPGGMAKLLPLSLWLCIQYLGTSTLIETVSYCHNLMQHMIAKLDEVPGIRRFNVPGNHQSFTVLFKYFGGGEIDFVSHVASSPSEGTPPASPSPGATSPGAPSPGAPSPGAPSPGAPSPTSPASASETQSLEESTEAISEESGIKRGGSKVTVEELAPATSNVANAMIARDLQALFPKVGISPLKLPEHGVSFRFDPINAFPEHSTSIEDVTKFVDALKQRLQSIHMTALARRLIEEELKGQPNLRCLEFPSFFGSGFIQYVPTDWAEKTELTLEEVSTLNSLNIELSNILTEKNSSFSPFQHGNFSCIMIKELQADVDLQDFMDLLLSETAAFEEHKKFLEGMSEKIKKGIEAAESDITKEKEQREQEEGYLRYVPIVGSVLNWFSPTAPTTPQGRTFNLSSGKVADTGAIYKYKMQLTTGEEDEEAKEEEQLSGEYSGVDVSVNEQMGSSKEEVETQEEAKIEGAKDSSQDNAESVPAQPSQEEVVAESEELKGHSQDEV